MCCNQCCTNSKLLALFFSVKSIASEKKLSSGNLTQKMQTPCRTWRGEHFMCTRSFNEALKKKLNTDQ